MPPVPVLVGLSGLVKGHRFAVGVRGVRIGRQEGNEIVLDDHGISRQHARVVLHNGTLWVQDLGSRNGVFVNEQRVQAHQQLNPGDRITVGNHTLEVRAEEAPAAAPASGPSVPAAPAAPAAAPGAGAPKKRWKLWPFLVTGLLLLILVVLVVVAGRGHVRVAEQTVDPVVQDLLREASESLVSPGGEPAEEPPRAVTEVTATTSEEWPPPPAGMTAAELVDRAHGLYRARRLRDALVAYHQARSLDATCEICDRRIDRLNTEIAQAIREHFDAGLRYYHNLQYQEAIASWEMVQLLSPDPESPSFKEASTYLDLARAKMPSQY